MREIKQLKKAERDQAEAEIEKTCEVFINAVYRVGMVLRRYDMIGESFCFIMGGQNQWDQTLVTQSKGVYFNAGLGWSLLCT